MRFWEIKRYGIVLSAIRIANSSEVLRRMFRIAAVGSAVLCIGYSAVNGQDTGVQLSGKVVDQNGASVAGANVFAVEAKSSVGSGITDPDGRFSFIVLPGKYVLTVTAQGFDIAKQTVNIDRDSIQVSNLVLQISAQSVDVTVRDDSVYGVETVSSATKTLTLLRDVPQSISVLKKEQIHDQLMASVADVVQYVPGVSSHQGENNRDEIIIRGNRSNADFYRNGVRDDVQYYRDLYNLEQVEILKGPNAMVFGRGGGGGVINRVTKEAGLAPIREFTLQGGSFKNRRATGDLEQSLGQRAAFRLNGVYENSNSFRDFVGLQRTGLNPTFAFLPDSKTHISFGYDFLRDSRTADRGITSFRGRPANVPISTFYGDPANSKVRSDVNIFSGSIDRIFGNLIFRNRTSYGEYDRGYQNYVPRDANTDGTLVTLTAYNNATRRKNFFNQTDFSYSIKTGAIRHTLAFGTEFGNQRTGNVRQTGYFNNTLTSIHVPFYSPQTSVSVTFRQSITDADNKLRLNLGAVYVQDQIELSQYIQVIAGVRYDYFGLKYHNNRNGAGLERIDKVVSPRFGLVVKPITRLSLYGSFSVSFLPSSGDQFSSLTEITQQLKPERFTNYEAGAKWDVRRGLFLTAAIYRLDRTNTRATDPNDPTAIIQTGRQRTDGFELGLTGNILPQWAVSGGYSYQNARITSATTSAIAGRQVGQVPHNTFSLWNKYEITSRLGAGLGVVYRSDMFAAVDNTVRLAGYLKADTAIFLKLNEHWRLQANLENLTNVRYYVNADSNTNISPGRPRGVKFGLTASF